MHVCIQNKIESTLKMIESKKSDKYGPNPHGIGLMTTRDEKLVVFSQIR